MKFKGDIIITDPCYFVKDKDWNKCDCGDNLEIIKLKNFICRSTIYGDWSCMTFEKDTEKILGKFCADAGLVGVFLLSEVLKYNPEFSNDMIKYPWVLTVIKNFNGKVNFEVFEEDVSVVGKGNVNFYTKQIGL